MSRRGRSFFVPIVGAMLTFAAAGQASAGEGGVMEWLNRLFAGSAGTGSKEAKPPESGRDRIRPVVARPSDPEPAETAARGDSNAAGFRDWVNRFWPQAKAAGVSEETYRRAFAEAAFDPGVLESAEKQAEFVKPLWAYLDATVSPTRIETGRKMQAEWAGTLAEIERRFRVDPRIVLAIWGMESSYGAILDNPKVVHSVISSLATLAYAGGRRAQFGRAQLIAALKILQRGDVRPEAMTGSWAGAMGHTQFIPTTYLQHAVDMDGDRRRDIWASVPDALASTANYLRASGWRTGERWGYEVELPAGFNYALADEDVARPLGEWERLGVRPVRGSAFGRRDTRAALLLPTGSRGPAFLILPNFRAILRYNNATSYALAVGHLADRIAGGEPFARAWPRAELPLAPSERRELQSLLADRGHHLGDPDGRIGPKTRAAIRRFQSEMGMTPDGHASLDFLTRLRSMARN